MLILNDVVPYHWAVAGAGIGVMALLLLWVANRRFGLSTGFESVCSLVLKRTPYFQRPALRAENRWRLAVLLGLVLGGALSAALSGGWEPMWEAGMLDSRIGLSEGTKVAWMFAGGLLIGFGTRLSGGCTSGHGIFGVSNFEPSGWIAAITFMLTGVLTTQLLYGVLFPPVG